MSERGDQGSGEKEETGCGGGGHRPAIPGSGAATPGPAPAWATASTAKHTLDARPMIAAGEHPAGKVMDLLATLADDEVLQLLTPFVPVPLIDRVKSRGYLAHTLVEEMGLARTFFRRGGE
jgi:hypothetical protein